MKIVSAIELYAIDTDELDKATALLNNTEEYNKTLWRLWDFGYKNILPKADYELIKPYIQKGKQK